MTEFLLVHDSRSELINHHFHAETLENAIQQAENLFHDLRVEGKIPREGRLFRMVAKQDFLQERETLLQESLAWFREFGDEIPEWNISHATHTGQGKKIRVHGERFLL